MKLCTLFELGKFAVTGEVGPPKGTCLQGMLDELDPLEGMVDAVNVTDNQTAVMRLGSLAASTILKDRGMEPVFQLTTRDRNRIALQSDLLSASALGIRNVLCLTGDHVTLGDHTQAKPVYDLDSVQLLEAAKGLNEGRDLSGRELDGKTGFCLGAVVNPGANPLEPQLIKMEKKIAAGARFIQTQAVYDLKSFEKFMEEAKRYDTPIMAGIVLLKSPAMARFMNKNVAGVEVPESMIRELENTPKGYMKKKSAEIAARLIEGFYDLCDGVHIMPLGWTELIPEILDLAGISRTSRISA
ncbi:MAG TPA: methylenetetrahydrofolate reductase [Clostridia bacterium]|nr:methylenetetrahydrofolate reductase [Clostridia bacterium]